MTTNLPHNHRKLISIIAIIVAVLLMEGLAFFYAFPQLKSNYGKTVFFPGTGESQQFSNPLQNLKDYTFSYPINTKAPVSGISLIFVIWDNPENTGDLDITVWDGQKLIGESVLNASNISAWQWIDIRFLSHSLQNKELTVTVSPKHLSDTTTIGFLMSAEDSSLPALKIFDNTWDSFQIFYAVFVLGTAGITILVFFLLLKGNSTAAFLSLWCWFIVIFMFLIPPSDGYDESGHTHYASITADKIAHYSHENPENTLLISKAEINTGLSDQAPKHDYYVWFFEEIGKRDKGAASLVEIGQETIMKGEYPSFIFFFYSLGILLGRKLLLTGAGIMLLTRFFGLVPLIALIIYALKRLSIGKALVFVILCFPATLQSFVTLNPDGEIIALSLSLIASTFHQMSKNKDAKTHWGDFLDYGIMFISCFTLSQCKYGATVPLCLIPLLILSRRKSVKKYASVGSVIVSLGSVIIGFFPMFLTIMQSKGAAAWSEYYTFSDVITHPIQSFRILLYTIDKALFFWWRQIIGSVLGNVNIMISDFYLIIFTVLIIIALFLSEANSIYFQKREKIFLSVIALLTFLCINGGMLIGATLKGFNIINGVQGRYFLPLLFPLLLAYVPKASYFPEKEKTEFGLITALSLVLCFAATSIFLQS